MFCTEVLEASAQQHALTACVHAAAAVRLSKLYHAVFQQHRVACCPRTSTVEQWSTD